MTVYEGMFLLDNDLVRADWQNAKGTVSGLLEKHGGKVLTSRRWGERKLAYPIKRHNRATFLLTHYEIPGESIPAFTRDLEINESILRYLLLKALVVPAEEIELTKAEDDKDFILPEPPADDFDESNQSAPEAAPPVTESKEAESSDKPKDGEQAAESTTPEVKTEATTKPVDAATETPATETPAAETPGTGTGEASAETASVGADDAEKSEKKED